MCPSVGPSVYHMPEKFQSAVMCLIVVAVHEGVIRERYMGVTVVFALTKDCKRESGGENERSFEARVEHSLEQSDSLEVLRVHEHLGGADSQAKRNGGGGVLTFDDEGLDLFIFIDGLQLALSGRAGGPSWWPLAKKFAKACLCTEIHTKRSSTPKTSS